MNKDNKNVIVTGGAGFIGSHLVSTLLEKGYHVSVVDNLSGGKREKVPEGATFFELDINDTAELTKIMSGAEFVFHLAALPSVQYSIEHPIETNKVNVDGTVSVLTAARDASVKRVIFASSSAIYGDHKESPLQEELPPTPLSPYALHKYIGEKYLTLFAQLYGLEAVSLRFFNVYGPGMNPDSAYAAVIGRFMKLCAEGKPLTIVGDGTQTRDFVHVRDVARALISAAESEKVGKGEVLNIGTGHEISVNELADLFGGERITLPTRIEPRTSRADITKAKELLKWSPEATFEDGIAELKKNYLSSILSL